MVIVVLHQGSGNRHGPSCTPKGNLELTLQVCKMCLTLYFPQVILRTKAFLFYVKLIISRNENSSASEHVRKDQFGSKKGRVGKSEWKWVRAGKSGKEQVSLGKRRLECLTLTRRAFRILNQEGVGGAHRWKSVILATFLHSKYKKSYQGTLGTKELPQTGSMPSNGP